MFPCLEGNAQYLDCHVLNTFRLKRGIQYFLCLISVLFYAEQTNIFVEKCVKNVCKKGCVKFSENFFIINAILWKKKHDCKKTLGLIVRLEEDLYESRTWRQPSNLLLSTTKPSTVNPSTASLTNQATSRLTLISTNPPPSLTKQRFSRLS